MQTGMCIRLQVFKQNGLERYEALGEQFDPNLHNALFEIPDPSKPAGTVAIVTKVRLMHWLPLELVFVVAALAVCQL